MKKDFLFPHKWRVPGWIMTALFGAGGIVWCFDFSWTLADGPKLHFSDLL